MPRIPDSSDLSNVTPRAPGFAVNVPDNPVPAALQGLGQSISKVGAEIGKQAEEAALYEGMTRYYQFEAAQEQYANELIRSGDPQAFQKFGDQYNKAANEFRASVSPLVRARFAARLSSDGARFRTGLERAEQARQDRHEIDRLDQIEERLLEKQYKSPEEWREIQREGEFMNSSNTLPERLKQERVQKWRERASAALAAGDIEGDPEGAHVRLTGRLPVAIRTNNPGNQWMGRSARSFGASQSENVSATDQPAVFPDKITGAAAMLHLLNSDGYQGKTVEEAIYKWAGGRNPNYPTYVEKQAGISRGTPITTELLKGPQGVALAKAMARWEAGHQRGEYPLSDEAWTRAQRIAFDEDARTAYLEGLRSGAPGDVDERYKGIPFEQRQRLAKNAEAEMVRREREAQRADTLEKATVASLVTDDLASVATTGKGLDLDPERVRAAFGEGKALQWQQERDRNQRIWAATSGLSSMPSTEIERHIESLLPKSAQEGFADQGAVYETARKEADRILKLRREDPAQAAMEIREIAETFRNLPQGDAKAYQAAIGARMAAQDALGIPKEAQSPITKQEAIVLTAPLRRTLPGQERAALTQIATDIKDRYGEHADSAFEYALRAHKVDDETAKAAARVMKKLGLGQLPEREDLRQVDVAQEIDAAHRAVTASAPTPNYADPTYAQELEKKLRTMPSGLGLAEGGGQAVVANVPARAIQALRADPRLAEDFDKKYGKGVAKKILDAYPVR